MSKSVGKSAIRVDAYEKASGRAKYMDDLCGREALIAKICHSTIAHGYVKAVDTTAAEAIPGVVKILTCFDVPDIPFATAGHPWSTDPSHQDVAATSFSARTTATSSPQYRTCWFRSFRSATS